GRLRMYLGIDLTTTERRPSAGAVLDGEGVLREWRLLGGDTAIVAWVEEWRPRAVAVDAPLSLPRGLCCLEADCPCRPLAADGLKAAERELVRRGIGLFRTGKRSIIKGMVYRAMGLRQALAQRGTPVLEVYPYASKVALFGRRIPKKGTAACRAWLQGRLAALVPGLAAEATPLGHDELDAVVAAYTAYLYGAGRATAVGDADEGLIYVPG
ncbi:MAG: DUF429 domain-containing protein, partial [Dehalococcoidia bacterium]